LPTITNYVHFIVVKQVSLPAAQFKGISEWTIEVRV
jgi:hypothetical protein